MKHRLIFVCVLIIATICLGTCFFTTQTSDKKSEESPASSQNASLEQRQAKDQSEQYPESSPPVPLDLPGLPNAYRVTPNLYRGAQPTSEGMQELKNLGVKTVINLRSFHSDRDEIGDTGLGYEHIYMKAWHPEEKEIVKFLQIATDESRQPVFVHCQHGADRTGVMIAVYRIAVQGWTLDEAIQEMTEGPYGFHSIWQNLITFVRELDIEEIRERAGLEEEGGNREE